MLMTPFLEILPPPTPPVYLLQTHRLIPTPRVPEEQIELIVHNSGEPA